MAKRPCSDRYSYLRELVTEFQDTNSEDARREILANLANFGYNPENYQHFKDLNIANLFLDYLEDKDETLVEFAIGGLCNIALDREIKEIIIKNGGVAKSTRCLSSGSTEIVLNAITALIFLVTPQSKPEITRPEVIDCMLRLKRSRNCRLSNLANIFLADYCTAHQIEEAKRLAEEYCQQQNSEILLDQSVGQ